MDAAALVAIVASIACNLNFSGSAVLDCTTLNVEDLYHPLFIKSHDDARP